MTCGIGRALCVPTGQGYVFSSVNCELYYKSLISAGRKGELHTFQNVFDEHGPRNFRLEILETCAPKHLKERKIHYLNLPQGSELNPDTLKGSRGGERQRERFEWLTMNEIAKLQWLIPTMRGKMTAGIRQAQSRPEVRAKMNAGIKEALNKPEVRAKLSAPRPNMKISDEHREQMVAGQRTPEARARMSEAHKGVALSPEHREHMIEAIRRPQTRAKIGAAATGRKHTPEARAKIGAASKARLASPEARAMLRARSTGRNHSAETRARLSAIVKARLSTSEARARAASAAKGRKHTPEASAKMAAAARARCAARASNPTVETKAETVQLQQVRWKPSPEHQAKLDAANCRRKEEAARRRSLTQSPKS